MEVLNIEDKEYCGHLEAERCIIVLLSVSHALLPTCLQFFRFNRQIRVQSPFTLDMKVSVVDHLDHYSIQYS